MLVHLPPGTKVEKHIHENSDDIIYVVKGKAKIWIAYVPNMISRTLESAIRVGMKSFPALLITGPRPRQSVKTTLLTERFSKSHRFVSLENPDVRARVPDDPIGFP